MKEGSTSQRRWALCSVLSLLLLAACGAGSTPAAGSATDDSALSADIAQGRSGAEVTFDAVVTTEPVDSGGHERFHVSSPDGLVLEVDHNTSLAREVPAHVGDRLVIRGQLYIDPGPRVGVHCTHAHTSRGCPIPGFIRLANNIYG